MKKFIIVEKNNKFIIKRKYWKFYETLFTTGEFDSEQDCLIYLNLRYKNGFEVLC